MVAIGKDRNAYLLNRSNLGGVSAPVAQAVVSTGTIIGAAATYRTSYGHVCRSSPRQRHAHRFPHHCHQSADHRHRLERCLQWAHRTVRDFHRWHNNAIVWAAGSDGRLRGYNGETGAVVFNGGGANELMTGIRSFNTGIAARGRIYYAADNKVYAFGVPPEPRPLHLLLPRPPRQRLFLPFYAYCNACADS